MTVFKVVNTPAPRQEFPRTLKKMEDLALPKSMPENLKMSRLAVVNCLHLGMDGHKSCGWCYEHDKPFQVCENDSML